MLHTGVSGKIMELVSISDGYICTASQILHLLPSFYHDSRINLKGLRLVGMTTKINLLINSHLGDF